MTSRRPPILRVWVGAAVVLSAFISFICPAQTTRATQPFPRAARLVDQNPALTGLRLSVADNSGFARHAELATVSVPIPESLGLRDLATLGLADASGRSVDVAWQVLARWGGLRDAASRPVRFAVARFAADVPAGGTADYFLRPASRPATPTVSAVLADRVVVISTRADTEFRIPTKVGRAFDQVTLGGVEQLAPDRGFVMVDERGATVTATAVETAIEACDGVQAAIIQRGDLGPLRYTARWRFAAGSTEVELQFRLENPRPYGLFDAKLGSGQVYFRSVSVELARAGSATAVLIPAPDRPGGGLSEPADGREIGVRQTFTPAPRMSHLSTRFLATVTHGDTPLWSGTTHSGGLGIVSDRGTVAVAVDRFVQNFPKALGFRDGALAIDLFPSFGHGPEFRGMYATPDSRDPVDPKALTNFRFDGGRWKTHRIVFGFSRDTPTSPSSVGALAARTNCPLIGHVAPSWAATSGAYGWMFTPRPAVPETARNYARFFDLLVDDRVADVFPRGERLGLHAFLDRGGTYSGWQAFGWENFGDLPWAEGWSSLHYDWPRSVLLEYVRTGDRRFLDLGRDMATFRRDIGQNHATPPTEWWSGAQLFEKGYWHGNARPGQYSHNWIGGLLLWHVMTGDEGAREAAIENIAFVLRRPPESWDGNWGSRISGWSIESLVDAANLLGNPAWLAAAGRGVARYRELEVRAGRHGYQFNPQNGVTAPWQDGIFFVAAARWALASGDRSELPFLHRMSDWLATSCVDRGGPDRLPFVFEEFGPKGASKPSTHLAWPMIEALSYSAVLFDSPADLDLAAHLFDSTSTWWQARAGSTIGRAPKGLPPSPVTFRPAMYPGTETKVFGQILRAGPPHLAARAAFAVE